MPTEKPLKHIFINGVVNEEIGEVKSCVYDIHLLTGKGESQHLFAITFPLSQNQHTDGWVESLLLGYSLLCTEGEELGDHSASEGIGEKSLLEDKNETP